MRVLLSIITAVSICFASNTGAQSSDGATILSTQAYSQLFGLAIGQSPEEVETYLREELGLTNEHIKSYRIEGAEPDGAQAVVEVSAATIPLVLISGAEPTMVPIDSMEMYFTFSVPLADTPELMAHMIAIRFIDESPTIELIEAFAIEAYGDPVIDGKYGYQWCDYLNDDNDSCVSSCASFDSVEPCPPNFAVGYGEYVSGIQALAVADWSAAANYKLALKSR